MSTPQLEALTLDEQLLFDWMMEHVGLGRWEGYKFPDVDWIVFSVKLWAWGLTKPKQVFVLPTSWPEHLYQYWLNKSWGGTTWIVVNLDRAGVTQSYSAVPLHEILQETK